MTTIDRLVGSDGALWEFVAALRDHGVDSRESRNAQARLARSYAKLVESSRSTPLLRRCAKRLHRDWGYAAFERCRGFGDRDFPEPDDDVVNGRDTKDKPRCRRKM